MGIRARNLHPDSSLWGRSNYIYVSQPAFLVDRILTAANGDLNGAAVGDSFTLSTNYTPPNTVVFTQTDFAGGDLDVTYLITGQNHMGEDITESINIPAGTSIVSTSAAWIYISSIVITAITANGASDTIEVGVGGNATGRIGYGIPMKNPISTDVLALVNIATGGTIAGTVETGSAVYRRTTAADTSAAEYIMVLDRDSPRL